ncbi:MAG: transposase [Candidatus Hydrogenedentes bacterium]|nr:transposase [Candidatus Hydrogenedentota bacterium]
MSRQARIVIPGMPHHVAQVGNNRQDVFFGDEDRVTYLELFREQCKKYGVRVLGYCLLPNHVHFVAVPAREDSLNLAVGRTHLKYAQYINRLYDRSGHLWQGRFQSCALDDAYTVAAMRYIESNPVRAKITRVPWTYRWSSAAAHCGAPDTSGLLDLRMWKSYVKGTIWKDVIAQQDEEEALIALRRNTQTGYPLGHASVIGRLERALDRRLRPQPVGRPRKEAPKPEKRTRK